MMKPQRYLIPLLLMAQGATAAEVVGPLPPVPAPVRTQGMSFEQMASSPGTLSLRGNAPDGLADFTVRRDEVVTRATLDLNFTPSPSLLPLISQVKVYLNDELMGVTALNQDQMGTMTHASIELDPRYAKDFNRLKVSFVGHYRKVCENPASDTLWLNVNRDSKLTLQLQTLPVRIDDGSTIDFSGYRHFIEMPNLKAFAYAGFPFSRMADLADSQVVMPAKAHPAQITTLLDAVGAIGAETGYPALSLRVLDDWEQARTADLDTLLIGTLPEEFRGDLAPDALLQSTRSWVNEPTRQHKGDLLHTMADRQPQARVGMTGNRAIAVILGLQSPTHDQRSLVALLADGPAGVTLLNEALQTRPLRDQVAGSVAIIRESGVKSLVVGDRYEVGYLPWWERLWQLFARYPVRLAGLTLLCMLVLGWGLRVLLASASRRRLKED